MYTLYVAVLVWTVSSKRCTTANASKLQEHTAATLMESMDTGRTSLVYFVKQADPAVKNFIEQLEMSADALEDYGIFIGKVNCSIETIEKFCTEEVMKIYLFRGPDVLRSFDIDTVFDVNAIVSHVLFAVLFDEVRYVHTPAEMQRVERTAKGRTDIVVGHISVLGLPEHRALMESAFVYGTKYQFVQTSESLLLQHMEIADPSSVQACLWFLHCSGVTRLSEPCPHTLMRRPLTTINIHAFLQLMETPLWTEAAVDPADVDVVYEHLNVPVLFLFTQPETLRLDRVAVETVAWRLRGEAGLVLIHRDNPSVKTPLVYNVAYRLPQEQGVKYFTLKNFEEVVTLFREQLSLKEEEKQKEDDEEEENDGWSGADVLDDEVAESVYRDRGLYLDQDTVLELTAETFSAAVTQNGLMVVLFYVKWDAVSMAFLQSYIEVAHALEGVSGVALASVDCGEWTDVCGEQRVTSFPTVMMYQRGDVVQPYRGMLGAESLHAAVLLRLAPSPVVLSSPSEVLSFLEGERHGAHATLAPVRVLGLFRSADPGVSVFVEAAKALKGEMLLGLFVNKHADEWAEEHSVSLPALVVSREPGAGREAHAILASSAQSLVEHIRRTALDPFPELTVENLPWYLELGKSLLLLFVGGGESPETARALEEMRMVQSAGQRDAFLPCWIHLRRTPAGRAVLKTYLGFVPSLPALVFVRLEAGGEVFHFSPEQPLVAGNVIQWLQRIDSNQEQPAGAIPEAAWDPPAPFYDFLAVMDEEVPGYAAQRSPKMKPEGRREFTGARRGEEEHPSAGRGGPGAPSNHPTPPHHTEL